jgi:lipopolysaccharide/colanic/teichoic acid biosynthesis glycosyltransferase
MEQGVHVGQAHDRGTKAAHNFKAVTSDKDFSDCVLTNRVTRTAIQAKIDISSSDSIEASIFRGHEFLIRSFDIFGSVIIFLFALPIMHIVALLIKIFSHGSVLYKQQRVGRNGKIFTLYKFRTMVNNAEQHTGPVLATEDESRVTSIGRILRRTRLDELPQLFNVLRGDMSLVGPRPERPFFVDKYEELQGTRLSVKPGITGLAQVRSFYNLKPNHKIKYDYLYIQKRSLLLNLSILLQTIPVLFTRKGW